MDTPAKRRRNTPEGVCCGLLRSLSGLLLLLPGLPLDLLLLLQHRPLLGDLDVVDRYVDFGHPQAGQALDAVDDVLACRLGELRDRVTVLDGHREVYGRLLLADLDADAAGEVPGRAGAGNALQEAAHGRGGAATHLHLLDLLGRDAGDLGDHGVAYGGAAALALQGALLFAQDLSSPRLLRPHILVQNQARLNPGGVREE